MNRTRWMGVCLTLSGLCIARPALALEGDELTAATAKKMVKGLDDNKTTLSAAIKTAEESCKGKAVLAHCEMQKDKLIVGVHCLAGQILMKFEVDTTTGKVVESKETGKKDEKSEMKKEEEDNDLAPTRAKKMVTATGAAAVAAAPEQVGISPWGPKDEIGRLNLITPASRRAILSRVSGQKIYDLAVDFYIGMPSFQAAGDPPYQMWMTHTPHGNVVADSMKVGEKMNRHVSYTGSAISMYAHTGTHIDALNHFGLNGKIWNGFSEAEYLGDRGWTVTGAEKLPPIVARGVLIDVAAAKGLQQLPDNYRISRKDLCDALDLQGVKMEKGDVVLIRTGRMRDYDNAKVYMANPPGLGLDGAKFLVEDGGAMVVGADNLSLETFPSEVSDNYLPVHTYLLAQQGAPIIELVNLEALARDRVYQFAFIGASLKFRGGDAAPIRPIALPIQ